VTESEERREFARRHASEPTTITVLTGEHVGGAGRAGGATLWTPSAQVLASVDQSGEFIEREGRLSWLAAEDQREGWIHDLRPLTQYVVRVRAATPDPAEYRRYGVPMPDLSGHHALDEVIEREVHVAALDARLASWTQVRTVVTGAGVMELDRAFGWFAGVIDWCGERADVTLAVDEEAAEGSETCRGAAARLDETLRGAEEIDARWRAFVADTLTGLAQGWQEEGDPIRADEFRDRIRLVDLTIEADGSMTAWFDDDDIFAGHSIVVEVDSTGALADASIAG
jgi:hypothetical protein